MIEAKADNYATFVASTLGGIEADTATDIARRVRQAGNADTFVALALEARTLARSLERDQRPWATKVRIGAESLAKALAFEAVALKYGKPFAQRLARTGIEVLGLGRLDHWDWIGVCVACERIVHEHVVRRHRTLIAGGYHEKPRNFDTRFETGDASENDNDTEINHG
jgi:hypothetical protein